MNKIKVIQVLKKILLIICIGMTAIWRSTLSVVSLIAYVFLMNGLMVYFNQPLSLIEGLVSINYFLMTHWVKFWIAFFILNVYDSKWRLRE